MALQNSFCGDLDGVSLYKVAHLWKSPLLSSTVSIWEQKVIL